MTLSTTYAHDMLPSCYGAGIAAPASANVATRHSRAGRNYLGELLGSYRRDSEAAIRHAIGSGTLSIARGIADVLPAELAGAFGDRFEEATAGNLGLILTPTP